jgi:hypothetical protein
MSSSVPFAPPGLKLRRPRTVAEVSLVIYQLYNACLFAHLQHFNAQGARLPPFDTLTPTFQEYFKRAASSCLAIGAEPRLYVEAQFDTFGRLGQKGFVKGRPIYPMPHQIFGYGAEVRYAAYQASQNTRESYTYQAQGPTAHRRFYREERKLQGLCRYIRKPEPDVLALHPAEFSRDFLIYKGVWESVKSRYNAETIR